MCGIAGYLGTRTLDTGQVEDCLKRMHHRGPDTSAWKSFKLANGKNAYLLHARLNIIDLDPRSNQPFHIGRKWMAYNGELYNYKEVQNDLQQTGETFTTTSDTEVLLRAIHARGWDVLDKCEGMWSFAVFDEADSSMTLSRDRFGEKPLYLYRDASGLYFGSEVKFITALLGKPLDVNLEHIMRYMVHGYRSLYKTKQCFFQGVSELPRASCLRIDAEGKETRQIYWRPSIEIDPGMTHQEAVSGIRERLLKAVELRLRADVPMAFCMSGGIDSNSLIGIAKNVFHYDVHGFTIMNSDSRYEEKENVEAAVNDFKIRHTSIPLNTEGFLDKLRKLVIHHDAPVYTISLYAHWLLIEAIAAHHYHISISGTASDELFTGYYDHHLLYLQEIRKNPEMHAVALNSWSKHIGPITRNPHLQDPDVFVKNPQFRGHLYLDQDLFRSYLKKDWNQPWEEESYSPHLLRNRMLNELFHESVPPILHEDDLNAMYYSVENRSPFLDRDLFEFAYRIPTSHLIRDGYTKVLLRDAMRGLVPDKILDARRKVGFNAPIFSFLDVHNPLVRSSLLSDSPIYEHVHREKIAAMLDKPELPNSESLFLFYFLNSKIFLEEFSMTYCARCVTPTSRPNIQLNAEGVCNACAAHATKRQINWMARERAFRQVVARAKKRSSGYDCLIPVSGGKDSTWQVVTCLKYGLNPLTVTWKTPGRTTLGTKNLQNLVDLGVDHIDYEINPKVERRFMLEALKRYGSTAIPMHMALFNIPLNLAVKLDIPLIVWGENSAFEYGGTKEESTGFKLDRRWLRTFGVTHGTTAKDWISPQLTRRELTPYFGPSDKELEKRNVLAVFLGYYFKWDPARTARIAQAHGFQTRTAGPKTGYYDFADIDCAFISIHHHFKWLKFGFTRLFDNLSLEIRNGRLTRNRALEIISRMGDQTPHEDIAKLCKFIGISQAKFWQIAERFRNRKVWTKENGRWKIPKFLISDWKWTHG